MIAGTWVRTPDGDIRQVVQWPYWLPGKGAIVLLDDDTGYAPDALTEVNA